MTRDPEDSGPQVPLWEVKSWPVCRQSGSWPQTALVCGKLRLLPSEVSENRKLPETEFAKVTLWCPAGVPSFNGILGLSTSEWRVFWDEKLNTARLCGVYPNVGLIEGSKTPNCVPTLRFPDISSLTAQVAKKPRRPSPSYQMLGLGIAEPGTTVCRGPVSGSLRDFPRSIAWEVRFPRKNSILGAFDSRRESGCSVASFQSRSLRTPTLVPARCLYPIERRLTLGAPIYPGQSPCPSGHNWRFRLRIGFGP